MATTSTSTTTTSTTTTSTSTTTTTSTSTTTTLAHNILTLTPEFGLEEDIEFFTRITEFRSGKVRTDALWDHGLRKYKLELKYIKESDMNDIWDFYIARKGPYETFLIKVETEYSVSNEAVGTGDGSTTQFLLDEFPVDTTASTFSFTVDGSPASATLSNNWASEKSYVTFSSAPGNGLSIVGNYEFYFLVRFAEDKLSRKLVAYQLLHGGITLIEHRWASYRPRAGNA